MKSERFRYTIALTGLISFAAFCFSSVLVFSQEKTNISNVDFFLQNNQIVINYDIAKAKNSDLFKVSILIKTKSGGNIYPKTVTGDIGENIGGGLGKKIYWDVIKDNTYLDDDIVVEVSAIVNSKEVVNKLPDNTNTLTKNSNIKPGLLVLKSVVLPGWGNYSMSKKNTNWVTGLSTYALAIGGISMVSIKHSNYTDYLNATDATTRNTLYDKVKKQNMMSIGFFAAAGAIWMTDVVYTYIQASKKRNNTAGIRPSNNYSCGIAYNSYHKAPSLVLRYSF